EKRLSKRIAGTVLIGSPYCSTINVKAMTRFFEHPIDWWTVAGAAKKFVIIHAKDDPLVPFDHALRYQEALNAELVLLGKGGHFVQKTAPPILHAVKGFLQ